MNIKEAIILATEGCKVRSKNHRARTIVAAHSQTLGWKLIYVMSEGDYGEFFPRVEDITAEWERVQ